MITWVIYSHNIVIMETSFKLYPFLTINVLPLIPKLLPFGMRNLSAFFYSVANYDFLTFPSRGDWRCANARFVRLRANAQ